MIPLTLQGLWSLWETLNILQSAGVLHLSCFQHTREIQLYITHLTLNMHTFSSDFKCRQPRLCVFCPSFAWNYEPGVVPVTTRVTISHKLHAPIKENVCVCGELSQGPLLCLSCHTFSSMVWRNHSWGMPSEHNEHEILRIIYAQNNTDVRLQISSKYVITCKRRMESNTSNRFMISRTEDLGGWACKRARLSAALINADLCKHKQFFSNSMWD